MIHTPHFHSIRRVSFVPASALIRIGHNLNLGPTTRCVCLRLTTLTTPARYVQMDLLDWETTVKCVLKLAVSALVAVLLPGLVGDLRLLIREFDLRPEFDTVDPRRDSPKCALATLRARVGPGGM